MTHAALAPLIGPEFDEFLGAPIGEDRNGTRLSVLSALARLDVDPWREAKSLARMPRAAAVVRLTALIDSLPHETAGGVCAADLVALLPRRNAPAIRSSDGAVGAAGFRKAPILIGLSAFLLMALTVLGISTLFSRGPETRANSLSPPAADAKAPAPPRPGL